MNKENCEDILMALAAVFDGEKTGFSPEQLKEHTANCESCRREIEQMQITFTLLKQQERRVQNADLWSPLEPRIATEAKTNWRPLAFLVIFLVVYKLLEMLPERDFGLAFKIVPLVFVVVLFTVLKENPFKINTELILEK